jgi:hypothetical protein
MSGKQGTVALSRLLALGRRDSSDRERDTPGTVGGTVSLKALAAKVLRREKRDNGWDARRDKRVKSLSHDDETAGHLGQARQWDGGSIITPTPCPKATAHVGYCAEAVPLSRSSSRGTVGQADTWAEDEEERAAIAQFDGGAPRDWAEGYARLSEMAPPGDVPLHRWQRFVDDVGRFLDDGWARRAVALGWAALAVFGADRAKPFARIDHAGLLWLVNGGRFVALTKDSASIEPQGGGAVQRFFRRAAEQGAVVLAWELEPPKEPTP